MRSGEERGYRPEGFHQVSDQSDVTRLRKTNFPTEMQIHFIAPVGFGVRCVTPWDSPGAPQRFKKFTTARIYIGVGMRVKISR